MGSVGIGCTVDKGVIVRIKSQSTTSIYFNETPVQLPTITSVVNSLTKEPVVVQIESELPLGYGFGISGAGTLACAFALNKLFKLGKNRLELTKIAHVAEIINRTGLGSVGTQITGGFLFKTSPGLPVKAAKLPLLGKKVYAVVIDKLETPSILKDKKRLKKINQAADFALEKIRQLENFTLEDIIDIAYIFAKKSGFLTNSKTFSLIKNIIDSGGHATMAMLGEVVISSKKPKLEGNYHLEKLTITDDIVHLL